MLSILLLGITTIGYSQNFGLGIQSTFTTSGIHGISAKFKMNDYNSVQAVLGKYSSVSFYSARYMKSFEEHDLGSSVELQPYVVGIGSLHTITLRYENSHTISSSLGYGIGGGVSWKFSSFDNFEISNEIAFNVVDFYGYNWSYLHFGFGFHYYFGNL